VTQDDRSCEQDPAIPSPCEALTRKEVPPGEAINTGEHRESFWPENFLGSSDAEIAAPVRFARIARESNVLPLVAELQHSQRIEPIGRLRRLVSEKLALHPAIRFPSAGAPTAENSLWTEISRPFEPQLRGSDDAPDAVLSLV
jgi:hypothetical protein